MTLPPLAERQKPGLSSTLPFTRSPLACQGCGAQGVDDLEIWEEADEWDARQDPRVFVVLCRTCSKREIDRHPRVYRQVDRWTPYPGIMALCIECRFRDGLRCTSPLLKANGGPGLPIHFAKPVEAFLCGPRAPGYTRLYQAPPSKCEGREAANP